MKTSCLSLTIFAVLLLLPLSGNAGQPAVVAPVAKAMEDTRPNIIFILADDSAYRDFSCMGQTNFLTPNIDRLAREGRVFSNAYAGGAWCAPSRSCLLTGMNSGHLNALKKDTKGIPTKLHPTVAEMLKSAGYATCVVGKWHTLDDGRDIAVDEYTHKPVPPILMPWHRGFDVCRIRKPEGPNFNFPHYFATGDNQRIAVPENQGVDGGATIHARKGGNQGCITPDTYNQDGNYVDPSGKVSTNMVFAEDVYRKDVRSFIRANASTPSTGSGQASSAQGKNHPFFIFYATPLTHRPLITKSLREFKDKPGWMLHQKALAAMTLELDDSVRAILDELKRLDLEKKTLVIFASDNGYTGGILYPGRGMAGIHVDDPLFHNKGPWLGGKHSNLNGGVTVPMIAWGPGLVTPGKTDRAVCFSDFMATAAELTGTPLPGPTDGVSIVPLLQGRDHDQPAHPSIVWPSIPGTELGNCQGRSPKLPREYINSVLLDERFYTMISHQKDRTVSRIFDTINDPSCQHDLAAARSDLCARASAALQRN